MNLTHWLEREIAGITGALQPLLAGNAGNVSALTRGASIASIAIAAGYVMAAEANGTAGVLAYAVAVYAVLGTGWLITALAITTARYLRS